MKRIKVAFEEYDPKTKEFTTWYPGILIERMLTRSVVKLDEETEERIVKNYQIEEIEQNASMD